MKVGLALPHYDFSGQGPATVENAVAWARRAESLGYDSVWVSDHFFLDLAKYGGPDERYASVEPLTALGAIAGVTDRVRLGTLVLCAPFRHPAALAKAAAGLDAASGGRLALGLGAGWYEPEFRAMGIPFPPVGERIAALEEYTRIVASMLAGGTTTFEGTFYSVHDAPNEPGPVQRPRPPVWIGAKGGPRMMRLVAEAADGWNTVWRWTPSSYADAATTLARACDDAGRDPATVRRSVGLLTLVGEDEADLAARWRALQAWAPGGALDDTSLEDFARDTLTGTPERCAERIRAFAELGVEEIILCFGSLPFSLYDAEQAEIAAERLLPLIR